MVMIDGRKFLTNLLKVMKSYQNIGKFTIGQKDGYTTGCLLDSPYIIENCKMTAIALSKQQALDADMKRMQHHLYCKSKLIRRHILFFIIKEAKKKKKNYSRFFARNVETIVNVFHKLSILNLFLV